MAPVAAAGGSAHSAQPNDTWGGECPAFHTPFILRPQGSPMMRFINKLVAGILVATLIAQPALAQSILRDAETETLFRDMSAPLIEAAGLNPKSVDIVMIGDGSINAFVAGGQVVYIHSGLIEAAENANEVQGVIAHELGHVAAGDVLRSSAGASEATGITLLSLLLGAAAIAAGAGDAGAGILMAGQQAALGKYLAFSRAVEAGADESARRFLSASKSAAVSGRLRKNVLVQCVPATKNAVLNASAVAAFACKHDALSQPTAGRPVRGSRTWPKRFPSISKYWNVAAEVPSARSFK